MFGGGGRALSEQLLGHLSGLPVRGRSAWETGPGISTSTRLGCAARLGVFAHPNRDSIDQHAWQLQSRPRWCCSLGRLEYQQRPSTM